MSKEFWDDIAGPLIEGDFGRTSQGAPKIPSTTRITKAGKPAIEIYGRASSFYNEPSDFALRKWSERHVAYGATLVPRPALDDLEVDGTEWRSALDEWVVQCKETAGAHEAAERGTFAHRLTEFRDLGRDPIELLTSGLELGLDAVISDAIVDVWASLEADYFEVLAVEYRIVHDRWRVAGTLDRIVKLRRDLTFVMADGSLVMLPAGLILVIDLKTGKLRKGTGGSPAYWQGYATQIAAYQGGVPFNTDTNQRERWPWKTSAKWGLIVHIGVAEGLEEDQISGRLILVDLTAGRAAGDAARMMRTHHTRSDLFSVVTDEPMAKILLG